MGWHSPGSGGGFGILSKDESSGSLLEGKFSWLRLTENTFLSEKTGPEARVITLLGSENVFLSLYRVL